MYSKQVLFAVALTLIVPRTGNATSPHARVVSASFYDIAGSDGPMTSTAIAGVPPTQYTVPTDLRVSNWNNLPLRYQQVPGSNLNLYDSHGRTTSVDVDWIGAELDQGNWLQPQFNGDSKMMNGTLQSDPFSGNNRVEVHVHDLANTFDIGNGYDVIIYADTDAHFSEQILLVDDGFTIVTPVPMIDSVNRPGNSFDAALDYDEGTFDGRGTWARFMGLTGGSFSIMAEGIGNNPANISGFQIVGYHALNVPPVPGGDLDGDGAITGQDYLEWQRGFGRGDYDLNDVLQWLINYNPNSPVAAVSVPEPGTVWLATGSCIIAVMGVRKRRENAGDDR